MTLHQEPTEPELRELLEQTEQLSGNGSWQTGLSEDDLPRWSPQMYRIFGIEQGRRMTSADFYDCVYPEDRKLLSEAGSRILASGISEELEFRIIRPDGAIRWMLGATAARYDSSGSPIGLLGVCRDVTARKEASARLAHEALHDTLTGLPNRALLLDRIERALSRASETHLSVAVLFVDLDRFKLVNDSRGHDYGDAVLQAVARRLQNSTHASDTVGRLSGDELVVVCENIYDGIEATTRAAHTLSSFNEPFVIDDIPTRVTASIGVAVSEAQSTPDSMIRDADLAMYRAKERGRNCYEVFDLRLRKSAEERSDLEAALWRAHNKGEFFLAYQPILSLEDGCFIGAEALLRWRHPTRGIVEPAEFISVAEDTGLIVPIGTWVMQQALQDLRHWRDAEPGLPEWRMSVNVSPVQLGTPSFFETLEQTLSDTGIEPSLVQLELTESVLLESAFGSDLLPRIRKLGVRLSIDDFGTGYSSLAYLKDLTLDELKIDETFVTGLLREDSTLAIVAAIVSIGRALGLQVTAEGVESKEQLELLLELGCHSAQGFHLSRPVSAEECFTALMSRRQPTVAHSPSGR